MPSFWFMPRMTRSSISVYWLYRRVPSLTECTACLPRRMRRLIHQDDVGGGRGWGWESPSWIERTFKSFILSPSTAISPVKPTRTSFHRRALASTRISFVLFSMFRMLQHNAMLYFPDFPHMYKANAVTTAQNALSVSTVSHLICKQHGCYVIDFCRKLESLQTGGDLKVGKQFFAFVLFFC